MNKEHRRHEKYLQTQKKNGSEIRRNPDTSPISKLAAEKCPLQRFTFSHEGLWHGNLLADFISKKLDHFFIARQKESRKP